MRQMFSQQPVGRPSVPPHQLQQERVQFKLFESMFASYSRVNPIFECTRAKIWRHPRKVNCKITSFSRRGCARARWKQQEAPTPAHTAGAD